MPDLAALAHQAAQEEHASHAKRDVACLVVHRLGAALVNAMMQLSVRAAAAAVAKMPAVPRAGSVTRDDAESRAVAVGAVCSKAQEAVLSQLVRQRSCAEQGSNLDLVPKSQCQQRQMQSCCCL